MSNHFIHPSFKSNMKFNASWVMLLFILFLNNAGYSFSLEASEQDDPVKTRMNLKVTQLDNDAFLLESLVRARIDGRYTGIENLEVNFYTFNEEGEEELGTAITDEDGIASLTVNADQLLFDSTFMTGYSSYFDGNDSYGDSDDEIELIKAEMTMESSEDVDEEGNVSRTIEVTLNSNGNPVEEAYVYLYVTSMLRPFLVGEEETDESGVATFDFPTDLPGDMNGQLEIFSLVEDNEDFGYVKSSFVKDWGVERLEEDPGVKRSLSSRNPPLWLLITFLGLLVIIWGHYIEVVIRLLKLKKI